MPSAEIAAAIASMHKGKREKPLAVQVRDRLGEPFPDAEFADGHGHVAGGVIV
ncbi:hypothetical protein [Streptomyces sp. NPDC057910]|uniref:hypothetical protein n=1 Tax=Streptomyces sp. NPDC057910 TaxID=3346278 RepID=UPI0036EB13C3